MSRDVLFEVRKIVADTMRISVNDVLPESDLIEDLCADSLTLVELLLEAEEHFGLDIPDEDIERVRTVQQAADYIAGRLT